MLRKGLYTLLTLVLAVGMILTGCSSKTSDDNGKIKVTTTIGMIADVVENVGKDYVEVTGLMGPGVDPHLYKASQGDIAKLEEADIIFYNGLNLEGKMTDMFVRMARNKPTIAVTEYIEESSLFEVNDHADPHVWFDVKLWMKAVESIRDGLIDLDPEHKSEYEKNAQEYLVKMEELDTYAKKQLSTVPKESRVLVTAHDAFGYFGKAYDIEVTGLQGISTDSEYGLKDVQSMVDMLVNRKIKAVFVESSIPKDSIEAVVEGAKAKGHQVSIGGELFSDAMGEDGTEEGTYLGMVKHNVDTIVNALK